MITKLPSGNSVITRAGFTERILKIATDKGFKLIILKNEHEYGTDAWANREIEINQIIKKYH